MNIILIALLSVVVLSAAVKENNTVCRPWIYVPGMGGKEEGSSRVCARNVNGMVYVDACIPDSYTCDVSYFFYEDQVKCSLKEVEPWRTDLPSHDIARNPQECHSGNVTEFRGYKICTGRTQGDNCLIDKDCEAGLF